MTGGMKRAMTREPTPRVPARGDPEAPGGEPRRDRAARLSHVPRAGDRDSRRRGTRRSRCAPRPLGRHVVEIASYLDSAEHVRAALQAGADAVHPGYGFLAESGDLADAVEAAALTWVGPPPDVLRLGGDKLAAKRIAREHGISTLPTGEAAEVGYPLVVKAAAGGGGRGMRVVRRAEELDDALAAAAREAETAFGDDSVFCERFLDRPRHVEAQLLADAHGEIVTVGLRDCSVQRRHQKVVGRHPPRLDQAAAPGARRRGRLRVRDRIPGRGTAEFLVAGDEVFFLELNARIQVEHPVTEEVTGLDLVVGQLRIAAGSRLQQSVTNPRRARDRGAAVRRGSRDLPPAERPDRAARLAQRRAGRRRGRGRGRDRDRLRPDDREARRARPRPGGGAGSPRGRARGDRGRGRDDEPPVPALARVASGRAGGRGDDRVPHGAATALGAPAPPRERTLAGRRGASTSPRRRRLRRPMSTRQRKRAAS